MILCSWFSSTGSDTLRRTRARITHTQRKDKKIPPKYLYFMEKYLTFYVFFATSVELNETRFIFIFTIFMCEFLCARAKIWISEKINEHHRVCWMVMLFIWNWWWWEWWNEMAKREVIKKQRSHIGCQSVKRKHKHPLPHTHARMNIKSDLTIFVHNFSGIFLFVFHRQRLFVVHFVRLLF